MSISRGGDNGGHSCVGGEIVVASLLWASGHQHGLRSEGLCVNGKSKNVLRVALTNGFCKLYSLLILFASNIPSEVLAGKYQFRYLSWVHQSETITS